MRLITVLLSFFFFSANCQDITAYNAIYNKTYLETSQTDFNKSIRIADSLYQISETPVLKAKSLMLSAALFGQSGEFEKALEYALHAEEIIENTDNNTGKAKIYGFLATHYRYVWLSEKSKKYIELGLTASKNITNPDISNNMLGLMMQEKAYYNIGHKNFKKAIENIEQAKLFFSKSKINDIFQIATNEQLLGDSYYNLEELKESLIHYQNVLDMSKDFPENYLLGLVHRGIALIYDNDILVYTKLIKRLI